MDWANGRVGGGQYVSTRRTERRPEAGIEATIHHRIRKEEPMKFVHAADLHLDSPLKGISASAEREPAVARALRRAGFQAWENLIQLCLDEEADFLVVAGDVFDGAQRALGSQFAFVDGLKRLDHAGIPAFVCHGNHDPLSGWAPAVTPPDSTVVFGAEVSEHRIDHLGVRLVGKSYGERAEHENPVAAYTVAPDPNLFSIGVLHASVGDSPGHSSYAPCTVAELGRTNLDYIALGHIHQHAVLSAHGARPFIAYPGCTQGRHIRESGPKGCLVVEVEAGQIVHRFTPLDVVRWELLEVDADGMDDHGALRTAMGRALEEALSGAEGRSLCARIHLSGRTPLDAELRARDAADEMLRELRENFAHTEPFAWVQEIKLGTKPEVDLDARAEQEDLLGLALKLGFEARRSQDLPHGPRAIAEEISSSTVLREALDGFTDHEVREALEDALLRCYESLEGGRAGS